MAHITEPPIDKTLGLIVLHISKAETPFLQVFFLWSAGFVLWGLSFKEARGLLLALGQHDCLFIFTEDKGGFFHPAIIGLLCFVLHGPD